MSRTTLEPSPRCTVANAFLRQYRLVIDTIDIRELAISFQVSRSLKQDPNTANISVRNLNPDHRKSLESQKSPAVRLQVGYVKTDLTTIYEGKVRTVETTREGTDLVTTLATGDGQDEMQTKRIAKKIPKGTPPISVFQDLAKALGVDAGNLNDASAKLAKFSSLFSAGTVLRGNVARELSILLRSVGHEWSIQNGALQILEINKALAGQAIKLTPQSGLLGNPSVSYVKGKAVAKLKTLLLPDLIPGRLIVVDSESVKGNFKIDKCDYSGESHSTGDWSCDIEASKY